MAREPDAVRRQRPLGGRLHRRGQRALPLHHRGAARSVPLLAARPGQARRRRAGRGQRAARGRGTRPGGRRPRDRRRRHRPAGRAAADRAGPGPARGGGRRRRRRPGGAHGPAPGSGRRHLGRVPVRGDRRPRARALRRLVRVLPALGRGRPPRHVPRRRGPARARGRDGLRRRLPAAHPSDRARSPQGRQQRARGQARRARQPVGDRRERGRPRRRPSRPRHPGRLRPLREPRPRARPRGGARLRHPGLARSSVGARAPRVVLPPARRHHQVRGEPAQEVPGRLPAELLRRGPAAGVGRDAADRSSSGSATA